MGEGLKSLVPLPEFVGTVAAEAGEAGSGLLGGADALGMALGVELVGVADDLFLDGFGLISGEAGTGVALADAGQRGGVLETLGGEAAQEMAAYAAVGNVVVAAVAVDAGGVAEDDAYVVEHGAVGEELAVGMEFRMVVGDEEGMVAHLLAMMHEKGAKGGVAGVIEVNNFRNCHNFRL